MKKLSQQSQIAGKVMDSAPKLNTQGNSAYENIIFKSCIMDLIN